MKIVFIIFKNDKKHFVGIFNGILFFSGKTITSILIFNFFKQLPIGMCMLYPDCLLTLLPVPENPKILFTTLP